MANIAHLLDAVDVAAEKIKESQAQVNRDSWAQPTPIPTPEDEFPVPELDMAMLPEELRDLAEDISERMQCPPDFVAVGLTVALSAAIGRKACIKPKRFDDWAVFPNVWGLTIGRPGVMKSPALSEAMKPLKIIEGRARKQYQQAIQDFQIKERLHSLIAKDAESAAAKLVKSGKYDEAESAMRRVQDPEPPPVKQRYIVTDSTVEALGVIHRDNPWGLMVYRDEASGLLKSLDKEGQEDARSFYLQGYDGNQPWTSDRIGRGLDLYIPAVCLAVLGGIQPGKLDEYVKGANAGGSGDDGLLQRFGLMVFPVQKRDWKNVDRYPNKSAKEAAYSLFNRVAEIRPPNDEPIEFSFDTEAQETFDIWRCDLELKLRSGELSPSLESHLSKYRKLVPALSLIFSIALGERSVSRKPLLMALAWSVYLEAHARKVYGISRSTNAGARELLQKIRQGKVQDGFSARDVYRHEWSLLQTSAQVMAAIDTLESCGYVRLIKPAEPNKGRPTDCYEIHPEALK